MDMILSTILFPRHVKRYITLCSIYMAYGREYDNIKKNEGKSLATEGPEIMIGIRRVVVLYGSAKPPQENKHTKDSYRKARKEESVWRPM